MEIIQIHYFCVVARHHSMSRAAEELCVSQSALSKAISSLEDELGIKLFDRAGRRLVLNAAGRAYYESMCSILMSLGSVKKEMRDRFESQVNEMRLIISAGNYIYNWLGEQYYKAYPEATLYIRVSYDPDIYELSQNDFHLYASPYHYPNREILPLMNERLMLAMNKNHPLAEKESICLADTKDYYFQCLQRNENLRENMFLYCEQAGFTPKVGLCTNDSYTFFDALASNNLMAFLPERTSPPSAPDNIVLKPITEPECRRTFYLSWDKHRYMADCDWNFIDFCKRFFNNEKLGGMLIGKN